MTFKSHEIEYLRRADLGRLATIQHNGKKLDVMVRRSEPRVTHMFDRGDFLHPKKDEAIPPLRQYIDRKLRY